MEYYSVIKRNTSELVLMRWVKLEPIIHSEASQKGNHQYSILMHILEFRKMVMTTVYARQQKKTHVKNRLLDSAREGEGGMM